MVIGAGIAGLLATRVLAEYYELDDRLDHSRVLHAITGTPTLGGGRPDPSADDSLPSRARCVLPTARNRLAHRLTREVGAVNHCTTGGGRSSFWASSTSHHLATLLERESILFFTTTDMR